MNKDTGKGKLKVVLIHSLFWFVYVVSEYIANLPHFRLNESFTFIGSTLLSLPLLIIPTYFIVFFAVPRYLKRDSFALFVLIILITGVLVLAGRMKWLELINYLNYDYIGSIPVSKVLKNTIRDYSVIALAICIYIISDWRKKENENKRLMEAKAKSDIELLKRQLRPHFLFNTLNNIYSLSLKNSDQTSRSILKLSNLLEYLVYQAGESQVALIQEINLVKNYIDLEVLRYGNELNIQLDIEEVDQSVKTAPLILLPFVENCFKHGGKNKNGVFWIKVKIRVFEKVLTVFIDNSKSKSKRTGKPDTPGVGLTNVTERLDFLYPGKYKLEIENSADFYSVKLELNIK